MNIPALANLVDEIAVQKLVALLLRDDDRLAAVPVLPEVKFAQESEISVDALWTLPAGAITVTKDGFNVGQAVDGTVGCGLLVEMPEMDDNSPGVREGQPATWRIPVVGFCEPNVAFLTGVGTGFTSSQLCQIAQDVLSLVDVYGFGTLKVEGQTIRSANDWASLKPGVAAHRITFTATVGRVVSPRSSPGVVTFDAGLCSIACSDGSAEVRYTTDGTPPTKSNPAAIVYSAPFAVASGALVLCATRAASKVTSHLRGAVAP